MNRESVYFVSDLHLGASYSGIRVDRQDRLLELFTEIKSQASHLFILGDLFEFWMDYPNFIPRHPFTVLRALADVVDAGVEVHYLAGNHDFYLSDFFHDQLGIHTHSGPLSLSLQGKKILLLHGDGLAAGDRAYRLVKRIMRHPLSLWLFRILHPEWGWKLAHSVGNASRDRQPDRDKHLPEYESAVRKLLSQGNDLVAHGHTHTPWIKELPEGIYVNTGEWFRDLNYVVLKDGIPQLFNFESKGEKTRH
jgi:UDP-2,3-diacylglucosamine hydrolase